MAPYFLKIFVRGTTKWKLVCPNLGNTFGENSTGKREKMIAIVIPLFWCSLGPTTSAWVLTKVFVPPKTGF